jgi:hypothetical protein
MIAIIDIYKSAVSIANISRYEPSNNAPLFASSVAKKSPAAPLRSPPKKGDMDAKLSPFLRAKNKTSAIDKLTAVVNTKYENNIFKPNKIASVALALKIYENAKQKNAK